jgi:hypothetical protein
MRLLHSACALLLLFCALRPAHATELEPYDVVSEQAEQAAWWGDFALLERLHARYGEPAQLTTNGRSKLSALRAGADRSLNGRRDNTDDFFTHMELLTLRWLSQYPQSSLAHALHVEALLNHAWWYRGSGYSNTVPPQAWEDFGKYVQRAAEYVARHADALLASSSGHEAAIGVGRAAGWPVDRLLAIARAGATKSPHDDGVYRAMLSTLLPKWRGTATLVDRYIEEVTESTRALRGMELYARMYAWAADDQFQHALFTDSGAQWSKMKQGYEDMLSRYPTADNLNRYAYFACLAQDKPTALDLLDRVGAKPDFDAWGSNGARSYETCKRWASRQ